MATGKEKEENQEPMSEMKAWSHPWQHRRGEGICALGLPCGLLRAENKEESSQFEQPLQCPEKGKMTH